MVKRENVKREDGRRRTSSRLHVSRFSAYFWPFAGAAAAPEAAPALAGAAPLAGAAAPLAGAAPALVPPAPAAGAAPVAAAPATAPAAPSAASSFAPPLPPTTSLRCATFGNPNTLLASVHFSISLSFRRRSSRVSTL